MELQREIKQELIDKVSGKIQANNLMFMLKIMLSKPDKVDKAEQQKFADDMSKESLEAAQEIVDLVLSTIDAGKLPAKAAA